MMDEPISFGYWIRRRRKALDLTSEELGQQVGCAGVTIRKIEADERRPSRQIAERLAECLLIPPDDRAAFLRAARAELAVDRLATPPEPTLAPPPPHRASERIPRQQALKGYELREQLGAGGFGSVYRAMQPGVGREVAVKIILPTYANQPEFIRRFEAEAQLVARLEHPHIVPLYDYWRESGGAYLVMRYVRGGNLQTALRDGPWSLELVARLLDQIGAALAFAHRHRVVHRDLKPANILLDEDGNAYLADFGIAKDPHAIDAASDTQPGAIVGSPAYLAPEQLRDEPVTPQSDIYSLGVLLYEALTGAHPFGDLPPAERLYQQIHTPLPSLHQRRPELPAALDAIVQRAAAIALADRYTDVVSLVVDWQHTLTHAARDPTPGAPMVAVGSSSSGRPPTSESVTLTDFAVVENPYKGLRAFGEADAADFFGRAALTQRLLERMAEEDAEARFLAVVGPSGSGKSSVVRAGLIPALRQGGLPGSEQWFVIEMLPCAHPLEELEAALLRIAINPPESLIGQLREDVRGIARAIKRVLPGSSTVELVLIIDQFEELFTLTTDEAVRAYFLAGIRAAVIDPHSRVRVVVTLRADFYDRPLLYGGFSELMRERTEVVLPLTPEELEQAIVGPAARVGVEVAPELVAAIVKDVGEQPGTLPLLQYALTELFERRQGRTLTLQAYRASGGMHGALSRRAEDLYTALDAAEQEVARQLFLRLVTLGEGVEDTRRRVPRTELASLPTNHRPPINDQQLIFDNTAADRSSAMDTVIDRYGRARLLSFDRDPITRGPMVEVAHEALLREWGRLRTWLDASRADVRMQRLLAAAAAEWTTADRDPSYLLSGARLAQFASWAAQTGLALTQDERAFLESSVTEHAQQEASERERQQRELAMAQQIAAAEQRRADEQSRAATRLRRRAIGLAGALVLALAAAGAAGIFAQNARTNLARSEQQRLAAQANLALDRSESGDLPALLALRSLQIAYSPEADGALLRALARPFTRRRFIGHKGLLDAGALSPDGKYALTGSGDKTARLWDATTGQEIQQFKGHTDAIRDVTFSPDGKYVLTGSGDKTARLWDPQTGQEIRQFTGHTDTVNVVAFSPDGRYLASGSDDKTARLWDVATGRQLLVFIGHTDGVSGVAFTPDGKTLFTSSGDFTARLWDIHIDTEPRMFIGHTGGVATVAFSPNGKQILTGSFDQTARLWDVATGQTVYVFKGHTDGVWSVAFTPDGRYVLTSSFDNTARLWDVATGHEVRRIEHACQFSRAAFSPDGKAVFIGCYDGVGELFEIQTGQRLRQFSAHTDGSTNVAFSPNGKYVLTANFDGTASLWDVVTGQEMHRFTGHTNVVAGVAFSPDSKYALTGSFDVTARLWDVATGREVRQFKGHTGNLIGDVAFSHNGTYVLTSGDDKTVRLWDAQTGQQLRQFTGDLQNDLGLAFSPDDKYVLSGNDDGIARLWRIDLQDVVRFACTTLPRDLSADERATYSITDNTPTCPKP